MTRKLGVPPGPWQTLPRGNKAAYRWIEALKAAAEDACLPLQPSSNTTE
ncbi:MAG TPA: hypothetical protein VMG82_33015 [Candidatus Sulfotelmatobacter sp.]|nr:hypothetical protein [Candidatus Sulfotelmatobacter sp.]